MRYPCSVQEISQRFRGLASVLWDETKARDAKLPGPSPWLQAIRCLAVCEGPEPLLKAVDGLPLEPPPNALSGQT